MLNKQLEQLCGPVNQAAGVRYCVRGLPTKEAYYMFSACSKQHPRHCQRILRKDRSILGFGALSCGKWAACVDRSR